MPALRQTPHTALRVVLALLVATLLTWLARHTELDDALIYDRYIWNALHGFGLVYNPGEHFNAMTSPLYGYLLLVTAWLLHGNVLLAALLLFGTFLCTACLLAELLFPWSGLLLASLGYTYTVVGMETTLLLCLITTCLFLYQQKLYRWLPLALTLLALTRFEAGALGLVLLWRMYRAHILPRWTWLVPPAVIVAGYLILNHSLFGSYLPQSSMAKLGQGRSGYWGKWPKAFLHIISLYQVSPKTFFALPVVGLIAAWGAVRSRSATYWNGILLPFAAVLLAFYLLLNMPNYHWYYAPFILLLTFYAGMAAADRTPVQAVMIVTAMAQIATVSWLFFNVRPGIGDYQAVGNWLRINTPEQATVEACEIGQVGWSSQRKVIDILGLTNAKNAEHIAHRDVTSWIAEDQPDYVVVHRDRSIFEQVAKDSADYRYVPVSFGGIALLQRTTPKTLQAGR